MMHSRRDCPANRRYNQRSMRSRRPWVLLCVLVLSIVNLIIAAPLFGVEYSAYNGSIEGTFIAIARVMAKHPGQWSWWPLWNAGMPFENTYLRSEEHTSELQ